ncbi:MAG: LptF/LptG family permease, partial [Deltaproteobacteria bacterium]|nr:LptF/LptG family permease [Deltaproteobacteria bacterium]
MTLLDRYLIKQFLGNMLLVLGSLVAVYLLVDFFERIDDFIEAEKSIGLAALYFLLKIPFILDQLLPVCILLAGIITIGLLYRSRELMSLHAGGINIFRVSFPIFFISGCITLAALA